MDGFLISNGVKIHYYRTGGKKPAVVLLHGLTDNGLCWNRLVLLLRPKFDLIMVDGRGHGLSDAPENGYAPQDHASDVAEIIQTLKVKKPALIGHSMGALSAIATAAYFPDLVGKLVLEDPPLWPNPEAESESVAQERAETFKRNILLNQTKTLNELLEICKKMHPGWDEADDLYWAQAKQQVNPDVVKGGMEGRESWRSMVARIKCPGLLITADVDKGSLVTPDTASEVIKIWKNSRVVHIPNAGHNIRRDQFEPFLAEVKTFL